MNLRIFNWIDKFKLLEQEKKNNFLVILAVTSFALSLIQAALFNFAVILRQEWIITLWAFSFFGIAAYFYFMAKKI